MRAHAAQAKFVTVSGDLLSHAFQCKYNALFPGATPETYRAFVEKTLNYVIDELYGSYPGVPVYIALGNNDSDCGDYRLDPHSEFLTAAGKEVTKNFPASERQAAAESFAVGGYYSITLPAPIQNARLLVLNDIFMSKSYATCSNKPDTTAAAAQITWLRQQLDEARASKQKVWVMGHIPPGVDPYSTALKLRNVCGGKAPEMFLSSDALPNLLAEFGDVIQLTIFGHTHMDEMRLLKPDRQDGGASQPGVALKMVPSISPIDGNTPSFTVALIDSSTSRLVDFQVFAASNETGINAVWKEEYDYDKTFKQSDFSAASLSKLVVDFQADPDATTDASKAYLRNYYVRDRSLELRLFWPQYVCAVSAFNIDDYKTCRCSNSKE